MSSVKLREEKDCLNCGHVVEENFCPHCGQENIVVKEDALHMVYHAIADYFHFEHKFFGTLKPLLLKPGQLTKEYVAGKRVTFIHPIRLYIFISIVFFLFILSSNDKEKEKKPTVSETTQITKTKQDSLVDEKIKSVEESLKYIPNTNGLKDSILKEAREEIKKDTISKDKDLNKSKIKKNKWGGNWRVSDTTVVEYEKKQAALPKEKRDGFVKHYFIKKIIDANNQEDPGKKLKEDLLHNVPKMMFLLLPMFALILKLVYINKGKYYYEHLIYSFHVHSAIFLSVLLTMLLQWIFGFIYDVSDWLSFICLIYIIWYLYRSLRTFYGSTRWITVFKLFFLNFSYIILLSICFIIIIAASFLML